MQYLLFLLVMAQKHNNTGTLEMGQPSSSSQVALTDISYDGSKRSKLETILIVVALVLFILAVVFVGLYVSEKQKSSSTASTTAQSTTAQSTTPAETLTTAETPTTAYCMTEGCIKVSASEFKVELMFKRKLSALYKN